MKIRSERAPATARTDNQPAVKADNPAATTTTTTTANPANNTPPEQMTEDQLRLSVAGKFVEISRNDDAKTAFQEFIGAVKADPDLAHIFKNVSGIDLDGVDLSAEGGDTQFQAKLNEAIGKMNKDQLLQLNQFLDTAKDPTAMRQMTTSLAQMPQGIKSFASKMSDWDPSMAMGMLNGVGQVGGLMGGLSGLLSGDGLSGLFDGIKEMLGGFMEMIGQLFNSFTNSNSHTVVSNNGGELRNRTNAIINQDQNQGQTNVVTHDQSGNVVTPDTPNTDQPDLRRNITVTTPVAGPN